MTDVAQSFAATFVDELAAQGVQFACVSPGSRSAPIAMALQRHPRIKVIVHIDERCGSFFAVGLGKSTGKPAVVLSTSGTAAAEFHPAVVEAAYSRTPLIVITADRPPELQGVGANQAIDQQHLFGTAVRWFVDPGVPVEMPNAARVWRRLAARAVAEAASGPVHLNLPFREPLVPPPGQVPVAEAPTSLTDAGRSWRDQDHVAPNVRAGDPQRLLEALPPLDRSAWRDQWVSAGKRATAAIAATLVSTPLHEGHVVRALSTRLPDPGQVFIGSSMPIRAADSFWPLARPPQRFFGNRGASGIDGLVSSGLGGATGRDSVPTGLLLGDLSLYHDMNGLWALQRHGIRATLVVCHNHGGGVLNFLPQPEHPDVVEEIFATPL